MNMRVLTLVTFAAIFAMAVFAQATLPAPDSTLGDCTVLNGGGNLQIPGLPLCTYAASESSGVFQLKYFTMQYGTGLINATNAGTNSNADSSGGNICANFYAFDPNEEMMACCACPITPNGLVSLDVKGDIYNNMLINNPPSSITVKVLSTLPVNGTTSAACDPTLAGTPGLVRGLKIWGTTLHNIQPQGGGSALLGMTETEFSKAELSAGELTKLGTYCRFIGILGSKVTGICKACRNGALGAVGQ